MLCINFLNSARTRFRRDDINCLFKTHTKLARFEGRIGKYEFSSTEIISGSRVRARLRPKERDIITPDES